MSASWRPRAWVSFVYSMIINWVVELLWLCALTSWRLILRLSWPVEIIPYRSLCKTAIISVSTFYLIINNCQIHTDCSIRNLYCNNLWKWQCRILCYWLLISVAFISYLTLTNNTFPFAVNTMAILLSCWHKVRNQDKECLQVTIYSDLQHLNMKISVLSVSYCLCSSVFCCTLHQIVTSAGILTLSY